MKILLTGGTGFVGLRLRAYLEQNAGIELTCAVRQKTKISCNEVLIDDLGANTDWFHALQRQELVVHLAARAHVNVGDSNRELSEYRKANVDGTVNLARQAASAGVKRFIFISSIGVNGDVNTRPFKEDDLPDPSNFYAQSKWEAEKGLWRVQEDSGMAVVIIRPPLIYGRDAPGNFGTLTRCVEKGFPLPLGSVHNKRSLVALDNLVDMIITCIDHPAAANQVFLAGDGEDISTTELLRAVAVAMGKPSRLVPVPAGLLMSGASILGKKAMAQRLLGSLQVDISKAQKLLGWTPPLSVEEGLKLCFPDH